MVVLVALRIMIGAMFFGGAVQKSQSDSFSSAGFLQRAVGPFESLYKSKIPDYYGWSELIVQPERDELNPDDKELSFMPKNDPKRAELQRKVNEANQRSYGKWADRVLEGWGRRQQDIVAHFKFTDDQKKQAGKVLTTYEGKLQAHLLDNHEGIEAFRNDLYLEENTPDGPDFPKRRDIAENRQAAKGVLAWVKQAESDMVRDIRNVAPLEQQNKHGDLVAEGSSLESFDRFIIGTHYAIGLCLIVGLFSRFASFGAGLFLLTVIASQPPWADGAAVWLSGPTAVGYQAILMLSCFALMCMPAGRWAGLDYFICKCFSGCCNRGKE